MSAIAQSPAAKLSGVASPLRILHVLPQLGLGGTENGVLNIIEYFGDELDQSVCALRPSDARSPRIAALGSRFSVIGNRRVAIKHLADHFRKVKPDVVHSRNWGAIESVIAARLAGVPGIIHSEHGYELGMENGLPTRQRAFRALSYRAASAVVTVSEELRRFHSAQGWISEAKLRVIPNGVDTAKFKPSAELRNAVRREFGIVPDAVVISSIGRLIELKDHRMLANSMKSLSQEFPHVIAMIVGDGPERENLKRQVASLGIGSNVILTGARQDVNALLAASDLFCLPSKLEGMSNTVLEAMASGLGTIATRVGANPELVVENETGTLIPVGGESELTEVLRKYVAEEGLRKRSGAIARERAVRHFSLELMMQRYRELYMECGVRKGSTVSV